jgi:hypothetical protein
MRNTVEKTSKIVKITTVYNSNKSEVSKFVFDTK